MVSVTAPYISGEQNRVSGSAGDDTRMHLKMFSGDILRTFDEKNILLPMTKSMTVGPGKTFQFPVLGTGDAAYHVAGENILDPANGYLNDFEQGERVINLDRPLIASFVTEDWDQKLSHIPTREEYARQLGLALANKMDRSLFNTMILAARATATLSATQSPGKDGTVISKASVNTSATAMDEAMLEAAVALMEKDVPMDSIHVVLRPAMYYALQSQGKFLNTDFGNAGNGSQAMGVIHKIYGFNVHVSNHIPSTSVSAAAGERNNYAGDFSKTAAVAFAGDAIATIIREGVAVESQRKAEYRGDLVTAAIICGHGILRPECAIEIAIP